MARGSLLWTAVLATAVVAGACSSEHEGSDGENDGVSGPTAVAPAAAATPTPAATPEATASPTPAPAGGTAVAFDQDIAPVLRTDCTGCHAAFLSYAGTLQYLQPGNAGSMLVRVTQPGGMMYGHLSGDRAAKADLIRRWVVDYGAQQSR